MGRDGSAGPSAPPSSLGHTNTAPARSPPLWCRRISHSLRSHNVPFLRVDEEGHSHQGRQESKKECNHSITRRPPSRTPTTRGPPRPGPLPKHPNMPAPRRPKHQRASAAAAARPAGPAQRRYCVTAGRAEAVQETRCINTTTLRSSCTGDTVHQHHYTEIQLYRETRCINTTTLRSSCTGDTVHQHHYTEIQLYRRHGASTPLH
ncbi:unnamed protein product [Arctogadus glacialis]